ncbi:MAG: YceI family protein [Aureispira sp.]|nr:YceI family protein [Aureispira sp.]
MKTLFQTLFVFAIASYFVACSSAPEGEKVDAQDAKENVDTPPAPTTVSLQADAGASLVEWIGTKTAGEHSGTMKLKSGELQMEGEKLVGGSFVLDMTSIEVTDLEGKDKTDLEGHLRDNDFFEVTKHPEGKFEITEVKEEAGENGQTHVIGGNLTLKDSTKYVELPAAVTYENNVLKATTPQFTIDRTQWGIVYKSSKVGDMMINDNMGIKIALTTAAPEAH